MGKREGGDEGQGEEVDNDVEPGEGGRWQEGMKAMEERVIKGDNKGLCD